LKTKFRVPIIDNAIDKAISQGFAGGFAGGFEQGFEQGMRIGKADMLLFVLGERFTVTAETRAKVEECGSIERFDQWARRVVTAQSLADVFAED